ncbi:MAG: group II intron reverse transcriptase/maturase [Bacteroidota bacterium]|nr:group II intron reverse transcriptase/maturase [Bacteroidota bacterium]
MRKTGKYHESPKDPILWGEGDIDSPVVRGGDVYPKPNGRVSLQWLTACEEERALTTDLMDRIAELSNLTTALRQVVSNGGSAGLDGETVTELKEWFNHNWQRLQSSLLEGSYTPNGVRGVRIPKPKGGYRQLGIPTVKDRLVQQAISQVLSKRYEPIFSDNSYGFRPGRNAHQALQKAGEYVAEGCKYVVDLDLEKFFDKVNHDRLMWMLGTRIGDKRVLSLVGRFLRSGIMQDGLMSQRLQGTPQGSPLSPLLSNIVLDELDKELEARGHRFVRYADDQIILVKSEEAAKRVERSVTDYIETRMKLKVNREKSRICEPWELNFLGHNIHKDGGLGISRESLQRFKAKLRRMTRRNKGVSLEQLIQGLNPVLRGWLNYFKHARMKNALASLEAWLRRRIRCYRLKLCKRASGIIRFLRSRNLPDSRIWPLIGCGRGWYRIANIHASNEAMNLAWFYDIGLFSLSTNYSSIFKETAQYGARTLGGVRGR